MSKALLSIDVQNDYFPGGAFPLWNTAPVLASIESAIGRASASGVPVIHVQHVADASAGPAPFFNAGTSGVELHSRVRAAAPAAPVVVKSSADGFHRTTLDETLRALGVTSLLVAGMMTQNCVTHTAISRAAERYDVTVLSDCCTTVSELLHAIALHALAIRVKVASSAEVL